MRVNVQLHNIVVLNLAAYHKGGRHICRKEINGNIFTKHNSCSQPCKPENKTKGEQNKIHKEIYPAFSCTFIVRLKGTWSLWFHEFNGINHWFIHPSINSFIHAFIRSFNMLLIHFLIQSIIHASIPLRHQLMLLSCSIQVKRPHVPGNTRLAVPQTHPCYTLSAESVFGNSPAVMGRMPPMPKLSPFELGTGMRAMRAMSRSRGHIAPLHTYARLGSGTRCNEPALRQACHDITHQHPHPHGDPISSVAHRAGELDTASCTTNFTRPQWQRWSYCKSTRSPE